MSAQPAQEPSNSNGQNHPNSAPQQQQAGLESERLTPKPELLLTFLKDDGAFVRKAAADKLSTLGPAAAAVLPDLVAHLREEGSLQVARSVLRAMAACGKSGQPSLIYLARSEDPLLKAEAIKVLSISGNPGTLALPALEHMFRHGGQEIGGLAHASISKIYQKTLPANFTQGALNRFALEWGKKLVSLGDPAGGAQTVSAKAARELVAKAVEAVYSNGDVTARKAVISRAEHYVSRIPFPDAEKAVLGSLLSFGLKDIDPGIREATLGCIRALKPGSDMLPVLIDVALGDQEKISDLALSAIRDDRSQVATSSALLAAIASDVESPVRARALSSLGKIAYHATPDMMRAFREALGSDEEDVRRSAAQGLHSLQPWYARGVMETFVAMLKSSDPQVCKTAISSFGEFLFHANSEEKRAGLALLDQNIKRKHCEPGMTIRQDQISKAASVLASGYLVLNSEPELQKDALATLAYAAQDLSHMESRRAAYSGFYVIGRQTKDREVFEMAKRALEWSKDDEPDREVKGLIESYLERLG